MVARTSSYLAGKLDKTSIEVFQETADSEQFGAFHPETLKAINQYLNQYNFEEELTPAQQREFMEYMEKLQQSI